MIDKVEALSESLAHVTKQWEIKATGADMAGTDMEDCILTSYNRYGLEATTLALRAWIDELYALDTKSSSDTI